MSDPTSSTPSAPPVGQGAPSDSTMAVKVLGAWLFVGIPLAWAVWQVIVKSKDLFTK